MVRFRMMTVKGYFMDEANCLDFVPVWISVGSAVGQLQASSASGSPPGPRSA